ncbi:MAG: S1 RNA-binding domain-containing protein [Treponema sp.]|nr:S1 RNA-binding domain-containing protein [Candidatus Treponema equi]
MKRLYEPGQVVETTVVAISGDTVFIDLGLKSEGFVDAADFKDADGNITVKEGDKVKVFFAGNKYEELHFTTKIAGNKSKGDNSVFENAFKSGIPVEGTVKGEIKGGFEVMLGTTRAFCPYSQMGYRQRKEPAEYVGQHLSFKITEFKNDGKNIVVSNRVLLEEKAAEELASLAEKITVGMTVTGTVKSIESYGAFIDLNGFQALLPVSEISRTRVSSVADVLKVGQEVTAKIIKADWKHERVSLSTKELEADPWDAVADKFNIGDKIEGKISRVADFGVFVNLADGIDGLVHISKLNVERNTNLKKVFNPGDVLPVIVEKIDIEAKRISLSTVVSNEEQDNAYDYMSTHKDDDDGETYNPFAALLKK